MSTANVINVYAIFFLHLCFDFYSVICFALKMFSLIMCVLSHCIVEIWGIFCLFVIFGVSGNHSVVKCFFGNIMIWNYFQLVVPTSLSFELFWHRITLIFKITRKSGANATIKYVLFSFLFGFWVGVSAFFISFLQWWNLPFILALAPWNVSNVSDSARHHRCNCMLEDRWKWRKLC